MTRRGSHPAVQRTWRSWALLGWAALWVLAVTWPIFLPGEFATRDMVIVHRYSLGPEIFGFGDSPPRALPQDGALALLSTILPGTVAARIWILGAAAGAASGAAMLAAQLRQLGNGPAEPGWPSAAAIALAVANPWIIERLLQGHWSLVIAAWLLPLIVAFGWHAALSPRPWPARIGLLLALWAASLTPSGALAATLCALVVARGFRLWCAAWAVLLWLPWLLPAVIPHMGNTQVISAHPGSFSPQTAAASIIAFAPRAEAGAGTWGTLLGLGGIWNSAAVPASRTHGAALVGIALAAVVLLGWALLWRRCREHPQLRALLLPVATLALLALGTLAVFHWAPGLLYQLLVTVPGAGLVRDSGKLIMLVLPAYILGLAAVELVAVKPAAAKPAAAKFAAPRRVLGITAALIVLGSTPDFPRELAAIQPRNLNLDSHAIEQLADDLVFFPQRADLVSDADPAGPQLSVDPYTKALRKLSGSGLTVTVAGRPVVVDEPTDSYRQAHHAWERGDRGELDALGITVIAHHRADGSLEIERLSPPAPPQHRWRYWLPTGLWLALPALLLSAAWVRLRWRRRSTAS